MCAIVKRAKDDKFIVRKNGVIIRECDTLEGAVDAWEKFQAGEIVAQQKIEDIQCFCRAKADGIVDNVVSCKVCG